MSLRDCPVCGEGLAWAGHRCPPRWIVCEASWGDDADKRTSVYARDPEAAAAKFAHNWWSGNAVDGDELEVVVFVEDGRRSFRIVARWVLDTVVHETGRRSIEGLDRDSMTCEERNLWIAVAEEEMDRDRWWEIRPGPCQLADQRVLEMRKQVRR